MLLIIFQTLLHLSPTMHTVPLVTTWPGSGDCQYTLPLPLILYLSPNSLRVVIVLRMLKPLTSGTLVLLEFLENVDKLSGNFLLLILHCLSQMQL